MVHKIISVIYLQLIAITASAGSNKPADVQHLLPANQQIATATTGNIHLPSLSEHPVNLKAPATELDNWLNHPAGIITESKIIPTASWNTIPQLNKDNVDKPQTIELGYILTDKLRQQCAMIHTKQKAFENDFHYAVNYDGNQLIYFGFSSGNMLQQISSQRPAEKPLKMMDTYLLSSTDTRYSHYQQTLESLKPCIIEHVMIHHKNLIQANHFSMKNNHIILDNKS